MKQRLMKLFVERGRKEGRKTARKTKKERQ